MRYEVVPSRRWKHRSGRTASIYGAVPYVSDEDEADWSIETVGYTLRDTLRGTLGAASLPFGATKDEAQALADRLNAQPLL